MDKISFPYRSATHLNLLHVVSESGSWERFGLDVDYNWQISKTDAHRRVKAGEVEFVGGNHVSTYGHRARGDDWVYLGQTLNVVAPRLAVRPDSGIDKITDLRGKKVGTRGNHPGLNDWLLLKQRGLDVDRDEVELVSKIEGLESAEAAEQLPDADRRNSKRDPIWKWVLDGKVDGALLAEPPATLFAEDAGLKMIEIDPLPMIWYTTVSSSLRFVEKNPDIVERFLKGLIAGVHFYKTQPEKSIDIIRRRFTGRGDMTRAQATLAHQHVAPLLESRLYPAMSAISNVYEEAKRADADAKKINPLALWDLHILRQIDDSGFARNLYAESAPTEKDIKLAADPEFQKDKARAQAEMIAAVKACGHREDEPCDCD
jgi:ABC-type nitrate/sulfonate/bicarbonate transport system substrate-binding protein